MPIVAIRRAELMAALSHAIDLAIGQPVEYALKSCVLGMRLAVALGLQGDALGEVYSLEGGLRLRLERARL